MALGLDEEKSKEIVLAIHNGQVANVKINYQEIAMGMISFKDVPIGGRIDYFGKVWVVIENYNDGLIKEYNGKNDKFLSYCSFCDEDEGVNLLTKVKFIG